ncbi:MAG: hypothetical protein LKE61_09175 [Erysipelotrichaceae bacterium]|nr:hypothetical protein [Erysipelotrichaceae bacterium]MCH4043974.1 hypothetical protein [Erysipelotrichaceae bacterium]MCH4121189.1 hypothetical protein [Erysipelotrichaceae bacterium]
MEYTSLKKYIRRYSFDSKMAMCFRRSCMLYPRMREKDPAKIRNDVIPDELETLAMFSVYYDEWTARLNKFSDAEYIKVINAVRNVKNPRLWKNGADELFAERAFPSMAANQFWWQESSHSLYYRFYSYFGTVTQNLDMPQLFKQTFGMDYDRFLKFAWTLETIIYSLSMEGHRDQFSPRDDDLLFKSCIFHYRDVVLNLSKTRDGQRKIINDRISDDYDLAICIRPFVTYPFVEYQGSYYLPICYAVIPATSTALMHRITDKNSSVKNTLHEVYEKYLFDIVKGSGQFDEVYSEQVYGKENKRTLDVLARKDDIYVLFDSKSFTPKIDLRIYDDAARESDIKRVAEGIVQVYKQITQEFGNHYDPFKHGEINLDRVYGILVEQVDSYILSDNYFDLAAKMLGIDVDSSEYDWLCHHVAVADMNKIEGFFFTSTSLIKELELSKNERHVYFNKQETRKKYTYQPLDDFKNKIQQEMMIDLQDIVKVFPHKSIEIEEKE